MLNAKTLHHLQACAHGSLLGLYCYAQLSWLSGYEAPDPQVVAGYRAYRIRRMRLLCYGRRLLLLGEQPVRLPRWRMPQHPIAPRRPAPTGWQAELHFTTRLYEPEDFEPQP